MNFIRFKAALVAALLFLLLTAGPAIAGEPAAKTDSTAEAALTTLRVVGDRVFITARLNGTQTEHALLDSGAEMSLVDSRFAQDVGLNTGDGDVARGTGGSQEVKFAEGVSVEAAGIRLADRTVAVLDLRDIAERLIGGPLTLIVGRELFDAARLAIDIEQGVIGQVSRDTEPPGVRLSMETHRGLQTIPVSVEGDAPVQADFDLGNGSGVLIGEAYAERAGLLAPERIIGQKAGGGIGGELLRDLVLLEKIEIAGVAFRDVPAAIDRTETAADLNVGVGILRNFRLTVDFAGNAVWLDPIERRAGEP